METGVVEDDTIVMYSFELLPLCSSHSAKPYYKFVRDLMCSNAGISHVSSSCKLKLIHVRQFKNVLIIQLYPTFLTVTLEVGEEKLTHNRRLGVSPLQIIRNVSRWPAFMAFSSRFRNISARSIRS